MRLEGFFGVDSREQGGKPDAIHGPFSTAEEAARADTGGSPWFRVVRASLVISETISEVGPEGE